MTLSRKVIRDCFWKDVRRLLVETHKLSSEEALTQAARHYHLLTDDVGVGDAFMHFGPEDMAEGIVESLNRSDLAPL